MDQICSAAKQANISVLLGFSENENNSLYISQCAISHTGAIVMKRRKLKPTHMERTVFGDASGSSLNNVVELEGVGRVGALSCWEHLQPLLKYHTISLREQVHVAAWPPLHAFDEKSGGLFGMSAEGRFFFPMNFYAMASDEVLGCANLSQTYAMESAAFVLHCTSIMTAAGIAAHRADNNPVFGKTGGGQSAVYGPDGRRMTEALPVDQEGFVYAELPMDMLVGLRHFVDPVGHYSRPDMLWLGVDTREKKHVRTEGNDTEERKGKTMKEVNGLKSQEKV
jgi:nitrilase